MGSIEVEPTIISRDRRMPWVETPLRESDILSRAAKCRIFLKLETLQPSGSFKSRGIGNYILGRLAELPAGSTPHFYCSSGGNAGLACVIAAVSLGYAVTVVVPNSTQPMMISKLRTAGASDVIQYGASLKEAESYLHDHVMSLDPSGIYVPPFDHEDIWAGNSTVMDEIAQQFDGEKPDAIICSVGGGGLLLGIGQGLNRLGWNDVSVVAVETRGAESLNASVISESLVTLDGITSLATSLGATRVAEAAYRYACNPNVSSIVLDDKEAAMGCWRLADDERIMVELACGVNIALCYNGKLHQAVKKPLTKDSKVIIILCGGSNVSIDLLAAWKAKWESSL